jgi:hypothetical protein
MEPTPVVVSGWDIVKFALGTGVVTAVANNLLGWLRDWKKEGTTSTRDARYLAMRVAVTLDEFAIECAKSIRDNQIYIESMGHAGTRHGKLPPLSEYPTDADWKALDPSLSTRALSFCNELRLSEGIIGLWWDIEPGDQGILMNTCDGQAGKCGYRAWQLAADMRRHYGLPEFEPEHTGWNIVPELKQEHDLELKRVKDSAADRERHERATHAQE